MIFLYWIQSISRRHMSDNPVEMDLWTTFVGIDLGRCTTIIFSYLVWDLLFEDIHFAYYECNIKDPSPPRIFRYSLFIFAVLLFKMSEIGMRGDRKLYPSSKSEPVLSKYIRLASLSNGCSLLDLEIDWLKLFLNEISKIKIRVVMVETNESWSLCPYGFIIILPDCGRG